MKSANSAKYLGRPIPKRVVQSKKLGNCSEKCCSTGFITNDLISRPRKTTKSDVSFSTKNTGKSLDYCSRCGDTLTHNSQYQPMRRDSNPKTTISNFPTTEDDIEIAFKRKESNETMKSKANGKKDKSKSVKQYYKNENFYSESIHDTENGFRKMSLDTIKELPETHGTSDNIRTLAEDCRIFEVYSDSEEMGFLDVDDRDTIDNLKKFRDDNYFETHSVKSRVDSKGSVSATSLTNHKCVYRFYLNDRLFPSPLSTDHRDTVRCVDCHLPMDLKMDLDQTDKANVTIQAKVKLDGNQTQDMILFLPTKDTVMIKERRKQIKLEEDVMYFGVIKLDNFGNSVFNSTKPTDSLALKYQKGYKEYGSKDCCEYRGVDKDDVIVI